MITKSNSYFFSTIVLLILLFPIISNAQYKPTYDLRDVNMVSPVKYQIDGTCWTFGTMSAIEGNLLMTGHWAANGDTGMPNLAEYHLDWWNGFNAEFNGDLDPPTGNGLTVHMGGDYRVSAAYLARGEGAVRDIDGQSHTPAPPRSGSEWGYYYVRDIEWYTAGEDLSRINLLKEKLIYEGVLGTCMCYSILYIDNSTFTHYQPDSTTDDPTHAISIIGWDDFKTTQAPLPGAWLCKNSWGDGWGESGYFWISYYDKHCGQHDEMGAISFQDVVPMPYDNIYYHDYHGWRDTKTDITEAVNVFTADNGELLVGVSFFTAVDSVDYTITIYDDTLNNDFTNILTTQSGHIAYTGFHTIDLTESITLSFEDNFYVYLSLSDGGQPFDRTSEVPVLLGNKAITIVNSTASQGESYYRQDGQWHDFIDIESSGNFCMKALTELGISFEADTTYGHVPFDVQFTGSSEHTVDTWSWDFGDESSSSSQNPIHTFNQRGLHTVTLGADIDGNFRSNTKKQYILAIADTIKADTSFGEPGESICITVQTNNSAPLSYMMIPFEYPGDLPLTLDSFNTNGCRTDQFEVCEMIHMDPFNKRYFFLVRTDNTGENPSLPPGEGAVLKIYMTVSNSAVESQTAAIHFDGYNSYTPILFSDEISYTLATVSSAVVLKGCCRGIRGNVNADLNDEVDISDLVALVELLFQGGSMPICPEEADLNASGYLDIDISDLVYMIDFIFTNGADPADCY